jgi:hypothetical protein
VGDGFRLITRPGMGVDHPNPVGDGIGNLQAALSPTSNNLRPLFRSEFSCRACNTRSRYVAPIPRRSQAEALASIWTRKRVRAQPQLCKNKAGAGPAVHPTRQVGGQLLGCQNVPRTTGELCSVDETESPTLEIPHHSCAPLRLAHCDFGAWLAAIPATGRSLKRRRFCPRARAACWRRVEEMVRWQATTAGLTFLISLATILVTLGKKQCPWAWRQGDLCSAEIRTRGNGHAEVLLVPGAHSTSKNFSTSILKKFIKVIYQPRFGAARRPLPETASAVSRPARSSRNHNTKPDGLDRAISRAGA